MTCAMPGSISFPGGGYREAPFPSRSGRLRGDRSRRVRSVTSNFTAVDLGAAALDALQEVRGFLAEALNSARVRCGSSSASLPRTRSSQALVSTTVATASARSRRIAEAPRESQEGTRQGAAHVGMLRKIGTDEELVHPVGNEKQPSVGRPPQHPVIVSGERIAVSMLQQDFAGDERGESRGVHAVGYLSEASDRIALLQSGIQIGELQRPGGEILGGVLESRVPVTSAPDLDS